jgi:segregation and condensation protein A
MGGADMTAHSAEAFPSSSEDELIVDVDGFEGPLDVLLTLARQQKVDLTKISILALAEQYLVFINAAKKMHLDLAADYLVMAAWLAYLKSRLLLPDPPGGDEPSAEEMAERLTLQLQRLEAIRDAAARLMVRDRLGRDVFARGMPEGIQRIATRTQSDTLYDLLKAYSEFRNRKTPQRFALNKAPVFAIEEARHRLERMLGLLVDWNRLDALAPVLFSDPATRRSAIASMLSASLEMVRDGQMEINQTGSFTPVFVRRRSAARPLLNLESGQ